MNFNIGDVVQLFYAPKLTAVVSGYAKGQYLSEQLNFKDDTDVILATNEQGNVFVFSNNSLDWKVVDHADMTECITKIVNAKEKLA